MDKTKVGLYRKFTITLVEQSTLRRIDQRLAADTPPTVEDVRWMRQRIAAS